MDPQQLQAEQEEEYLTNRLMKRLATLKQEKEDLARQVEVEEEMITNKLSKKLEQARCRGRCTRLRVAWRPGSHAPPHSPLR